jgi:hypothetical protein
MAIAFSQATTVDGALSLPDPWGVIALIAANLFVVGFAASWGPLVWERDQREARIEAVGQGQAGRREDRERRGDHEVRDPLSGASDAQGHGPRAGSSRTWWPESERPASGAAQGPAPATFRGGALAACLGEAHGLARRPHVHEPDHEERDQREARIEAVGQGQAGRREDRERRGGVIALIAANLFVVGFAASWGPLVWLLLGEMFPNTEPIISRSLRPRMSTSAMAITVETRFVSEVITEIVNESDSWNPTDFQSSC